MLLTYSPKEALIKSAPLKGTAFRQSVNARYEAGLK